jgi:hypothetical protein
MHLQTLSDATIATHDIAEIYLVVNGCDIQIRCNAKVTVLTENGEPTYHVSIHPKDERELEQITTQISTVDYADCY